MRNNILKAIVLVVVIVATLTVNTLADTQTTSIELDTRSILLIDQSGSMDDRDAIDTVIAKIDTTSYDVIGYFNDGQISLESSSEGHGNSYICETIDQVVKSGFTHITFVTDGQQWPPQYEALGIYTDIDLTLHLVEETEDSEEFINQLKGRMVNSNLKVVTPEGEEQVILNNYQAPVYTISIEIPEKEETIDIVNESENIISEEENIDSDSHCKWWLAFLLGILVAALFDLIHELITRGRNKESENESTTKTKKGVANLVSKSRFLMVDMSGSMATFSKKILNYVQNFSGQIWVFSDKVEKTTLSKINFLTPGGKTYGYEALRKAYELGVEELNIFTDGEFNGPTSVEQLLKEGVHFKSIRVITPDSCSNTAELRQLTDKLEVVVCK